MSETIVIAIIGGIVSIVLLWMQQNSAAKLARIALSQKNLEQAQGSLHKQINSRMDELLELTRKSSKAEGKKEEKDEQNGRDSKTT